VCQLKVAANKAGLLSTGRAGVAREVGGALHGPLDLV
jgi:hypothetical protein